MLDYDACSCVFYIMKTLTSNEATNPQKHSSMGKNPGRSEPGERECTPQPASLVPPSPSQNFQLWRNSRAQKKEHLKGTGKEFRYPLIKCWKCPFSKKSFEKSEDAIVVQDSQVFFFIRPFRKCPSHQKCFFERELPVKKHLWKGWRGGGY